MTDPTPLNAAELADLAKVYRGLSQENTVMRLLKTIEARDRVALDLNEQIQALCMEPLKFAVKEIDLHAKLEEAEKQRDGLLKALRELSKWVGFLDMYDGKNPEQRGATCLTAFEVGETVKAAIAAAGDHPETKGEA